MEPRDATDNIKKCEAFGASLQMENVTVNFANFVPAGTNLTFTQDYNLSTCGIPSQVVSVDLCRIAMYVATSDRSGMWWYEVLYEREEAYSWVIGITLEAWLPTNWTGRFLSTGNGGISGCIQCQYLSIEPYLTEIFYKEFKLTDREDYDLAYAAGFGFATVGNVAPVPQEA